MYELSNRTCTLGYIWTYIYHIYIYIIGSRCGRCRTFFGRTGDRFLRCFQLTFEFPQTFFAARTFSLHFDWYNSLSAVVFLEFFFFRLQLLDLLLCCLWANYISSLLGELLVSSFAAATAAAAEATATANKKTFLIITSFRFDVAVARASFWPSWLAGSTRRLCYFHIRPAI